MKKVLVVGASVASVGAVGLLIWVYSKVISRKKNHTEIQIPNSAMGYVIGRTGDNLKNIQTKSKTVIKFIAPERNSDYTTCIIKGNSNSVKLAVSFINHIVENFNNREDSESELSGEFEYEGSEDKLNDISSIVKEIFASDCLGTEPISVQTESVTDFITRHTQKIFFPGGDGLIPVYVSAVVDPEKFWIQLIKTKEHADLDRLTLEMHDYYESNSHITLPHFSDIKNGYLCAVFFEEDNRWYRAKVCDVSKNDQNTLNTVVDLYLLDFGESIYEKISNLRSIPPEFLNLNFQAIECGLANVKAIGDDWTDEALQCFEDIVHVGQWYTLMARIDFHEEGCRPYLTLIDNNSEMSTNIAQILISNGFAKILH